MSQESNLQPSNPEAPEKDIRKGFVELAHKIVGDALSTKNYTESEPMLRARAEVVNGYIDGNSTLVSDELEEYKNHIRQLKLDVDSKRNSDLQGITTCLALADICFETTLMTWDNKELQAFLLDKAHSELNWAKYYAETFGYPDIVDAVDEAI